MPLLTATVTGQYNINGGDDRRGARRVRVRVASRLRVAWHNELNVPTGHKWPLDSCLRDSDASDRAGRQIN